jgi:hypothetical protein
MIVSIGKMGAGRNASGLGCERYSVEIGATTLFAPVARQNSVETSNGGPIGWKNVEVDESNGIRAEDVGDSDAIFKRPGVFSRSVGSYDLHADGQWPEVAEDLMASDRRFERGARRCAAIFTPKHHAVCARQKRSAELGLE